MNPKLDEITFYVESSVSSRFENRISSDRYATRIGSSSNVILVDGYLSKAIRAGTDGATRSAAAGTIPPLEMFEPAEGQSGFHSQFEAGPQFHISKSSEACVLGERCENPFETYLVLQHFECHPC